MKHINKFNFKPKKVQVNKTESDKHVHEKIHMGKKDLKLNQKQDPHGHYYGKKWYPN